MKSIKAPAMNPFLFQICYHWEAAIIQRLQHQRNNLLYLITVKCCLAKWSSTTQPRTTLDPRLRANPTKWPPLLVPWTVVRTRLWNRYCLNLSCHTHVPVALRVVTTCYLRWWVWTKSGPPLLLHNLRPTLKCIFDLHLQCIYILCWKWLTWVTNFTKDINCTKDTSLAALEECYPRVSPQAVLVQHPFAHKVFQLIWPRLHELQSDQLVNRAEVPEQSTFSTSSESGPQLNDISGVRTQQ